MKKNFKTILFCAAVLALPLGCQKSTVEERNGEKSDFEAIVKDVLKEVGTTKTYLTANDEIAWSDKDTVLVIGKTSAEMMVATLGGDATHGFLTKLSDEIPEPATTGKAYTAFYPAKMFTGSTATAGTGTLPASYNFAAAQASPLKCLPMYATSGNKTLEFKSACGVLALSMKGVMTVTKVELSSDDAIAGAFSIDPVTGDVTFSGADTKVTVDFGTGVALNRVAGVKIYIPLCEGTYDNVKLKVYTKEMDEKGGSCEHSYPSIDIKKGDLHVNEFTVDRDAVQLWAGGPKFATANLGAAEPCEYGDYYMWGMTEKIYGTKSVSGPSGGIYTVTFSDWTTGYSDGFSWKSYVNFDPWDGSATYVSDATESSTFAKYNFAGSVISENDDAAKQLWGSEWRVPSQEEIHAMVDNCYWSWATYKTAAGEDVAGYIVYAKKSSGSYDYRTDAHVFLPASGYCGGTNLAEPGVVTHYWSNTLSSNINVYTIRFTSSAVEKSYRAKYWGFVIRPVHD